MTERVSPDDESRSAEMIVTAVDRTRVAGRARIELTFGARWVPPMPDRPTGRPALPASSPG
jgi:hypothetical protein